MRAIAPAEQGEPFFVRYEKGESFDSVSRDLVGRGVLRNADAFKIYCYLNKEERTVRAGTFQLNKGMTAAQVVHALKRPIEQQVRIPEGWWIARVAPILEKNNVCTADEYIEATRHPELFQEDVSFPLPKGTLEGYLYPDTYDLPPLLGAEAVVKRQLKAFEEKVWRPFNRIPLDSAPELGDVLIKASLIELEAGVDADRPTIAGVIENRLAVKQRLQIDATVLYALQEWKVLGPGEVNKVDSPYNTYKIDGLPPGPIGSPAWRSVEAALKPAVHPYFFYVARPDLTHYFSATYAEHLQNINKARAEFATKRSM